MEDDLDRIRNAQNQQELMTSFKDFGRSLGELNDRAGRRQMVCVSVIFMNQSENWNKRALKFVRDFIRRG